MEKLTRAQLVKTARKDMKLTQVKFAKVMNVDQTAVSLWESEQCGFSNDRVKSLHNEYKKIVKDEDKTKLLFQPFIDEILGEWK